MSTLLCTKDYSITIASLNRVRIKNFNPADFIVGPCATCFASGLPSFNGEFPVFSTPPDTYEIAAGVSVLGYEPSPGGNNWVQQFGPGLWVVSIACNGAPGKYVWLSNARFAATPDGIYTRNVGSCATGPASIEIEFY